MDQDKKDTLLAIGLFLGILIFFLAIITAIIGIPAFAIIEIIKVIKE